MGSALRDVYLALQWIALTCSVHSTSAQMEKGDGLSARTVALAKPQRSSTIASRGRDGHKRRKSGAARRSNWVVLPNPRNSTIASRGSHGHKRRKNGAARRSNWVVLPNPRNSTIASRGRDGHKRRKSGAARRSNWVVL